MIRFKLFDIPIFVQGWFFLLTAVIGGAFRANTPEQWQGVIVFMMAAFVSILIHELGHAFAGLRFGAPAVAISLHGFGGSASFPGERFSRKQRILMTAAGPGASIALAIVFLLVGNFAIGSVEPIERGAVPLWVQFINVTIFINLFWSVINLFPALPMDGGQILRDLLGPSQLKLTCIISFITIAILATGLWMLTQSIFNLLIALLLGSHTWSVYKQANQ